MTVNATPNVPVSTPATANNSVKPATPDLIQFNSADIPIEFMTDLLFEDIGGQEILSVSRNDTINGQKVIYNPIKNISQVNAKYSPQNLFVITDTASSYFNNYSINLQEKVPEIGTNTSKDQVANVVYLDPTDESIIVNLVNLRTGEQVEINVVNHIEQLDDIMY